MNSLRNSVQLIGRLGKDPEVKTFGDKKKAAFSIATSDSYKNQKGEKVEDTQWHNLVIWGKLADVAGKRGAHSFVLLLDGIEDPHNLGAIIRTAEGAGADGIIIPERRAASVTGTVVKASAGASEYLPIARVTNAGRALEELKSNNIWTVGLDERGDKLYDEIDYKMDCALVLGAEGHGLHEQIRKKCDFLVKIPMAGKVPSLNVSVAAAVVMYEVARQRRKYSVPQ